MKIFLKTTLFYVFFFGVVLLGAATCEKDTNIPTNIEAAHAAPPPCDSLKNVTWGDTLRVVKPGYRNIARGIYNGKPYWQAIISSNNEIKPSKFKNNPLTHRVVIADTTEITENTIFLVARIK